jgi:hypothetical protein
MTAKVCRCFEPDLLRTKNSGSKAWRKLPVVALTGVPDGFTRDEKLHSPILLPACGVVTRGYRRSAAEAFRGKGIGRYALSRPSGEIAHRT